MTTETTTAFKWYIVRTQSNREKSISAKILKEGDTGDLVGKVGRVLVPTEKSFSLKDGKKIMKEKVTYSGYIFIETNAIAELKYYLKGVNGAQGFLTNRAGDVLPLKNSEIDRMLGLQQKVVEQQESENKYIVGEEIKILDGPFKSFAGTVESLIGEKVKIGVMIFGRKTIVDLGILQIDKVHG